MKVCTGFFVFHLSYLPVLFARKMLMMIESSVFMYVLSVKFK